MNNSILMSPLRTDSIELQHDICKRRKREKAIQNSFTFMEPYIHLCITSLVRFTLFNSIQFTLNVFYYSFFHARHVLFYLQLQLQRLAVPIEYGVGVCCLRSEAKQSSDMGLLSLSLSLCVVSSLRTKANS